MLLSRREDTYEYIVNISSGKASTLANVLQSLKKVKRGEKKMSSQDEKLNWSPDEQATSYRGLRGYLLLWGLGPQA